MKYFQAGLIAFVAMLVAFFGACGIIAALTAPTFPQAIGPALAGASLLLPAWVLFLLAKEEISGPGF